MTDFDRCRGKFVLDPPKADSFTFPIKTAPNTQWPVDKTANCPCRPENGGSGVCGCVLGGAQVTC